MCSTLKPISPLAGMRVAVKDVFSFKGVSVSGGSQTYYSISRPLDETAPVIRLLIEAGANVVGSTKLSSLMSREEPAEAVDFPAPFNPRADGYQSPAGSSSGTGAAIGAYHWLDLGIGTDSNGGSRRPALASGCFQLRLTRALVDQRCTLSCSAEFDAPAIFSRSIDILSRAADVVLKQQPNLRLERENKVILYPSDYLPVGCLPQDHLTDTFVSDLAKALGARVHPISISDEWEQSRPREARSMSQTDFLAVVGKEAFLYDFYRSTDWFRKEFRQRFAQPPFVNDSIQWRWDIGSKITKEARDEAFDRVRIYREWFLSHILGRNDRMSFMVLPIDVVKPVYRDDPPPPPCIQQGAGSLFLAPILGAPELSIPIGQIPYHSRITQREEFLPLVVSLLGPPGSDTALLHAAKLVLSQPGRHATVAAGATMFPNDGKAPGSQAKSEHSSTPPLTSRASISTLESDRPQTL